MSSTELWTNNARSTLAAGISSGASALTLATGEGARFPSPGANQYFNATLIDGSGNYEIVKVTARSTDTLTIVRAQQGTSAQAFLLGDTVSLRVTKNAFERFVQKDGDETITGTLTVPTPISAGHAANKAYADLMLPLAGGTMTGALTLAGAPSSGNHPATKTYVDAADAALSAAIAAINFTASTTKNFTYVGSDAGLGYVDRVTDATLTKVGTVFTLTVAVSRIYTQPGDESGD